MIEKIKELARIFSKYKVKYLFIGKTRAILYGYPGTTQDIDIFPKKSKENCENLVVALEKLGFNLDKTLKEAIIAAKGLYPD